jgi:hypothetical protein
MVSRIRLIFDTSAAVCNKLRSTPVKLGDEGMTEIIFQVLLLTGVWLGVVLLNAVRKCAESLRDSMSGSSVDEMCEILRSIEKRVEALANDYHTIHPALRNVDDEIY